jgi:hypothetical protein
MSAKRISQREARDWKRRAIAAESLLPAAASTPSPRLAIATFTLDDTMAAKMAGAEAFGASVRVEQNFKGGRTFTVFAYRPEARDATR